MKKSFSRALAVLLAAALLLCGAAPLMAGAAEGVDITAKFTDPAFRAAVQEKLWWKAADEPILDTDVAEIQYLDVRSMGIKSLAGLEYLAGLEGLKCSDNQLTSLPELPPRIWRLDCDNNKLTSLPKLPPSLTGLYCFSNQLTSLPEMPPEMFILFCSNNRLTSLPELPDGLWILSCWNNQLRSLPKLPTSLEYLECHGNRLTSLDVSGLQLERLWCHWNYMFGESAVKGFTGTWDGDNFIFDLQNYFGAALQWILKYILFGWLWMRYV